ncbi:MAG: hypothetical protein LBL73_00215 [Synergistaceae bacterium]|jgi:hypothetical protein|nr:hypothetical protein [Synergistaceae bacterium]
MMIRLRSAFLFVLIGCLASFVIGFSIGILEARTFYLGKVMEMWTERMVVDPAISPRRAGSSENWL